jgi:SAM-dependent methyltransferase
MGLGGQAIDAIGREHAHRPITGDVLFIGRQTVYFSPAELVGRLRDHCREVDASAIEVDRTTLNRRMGGEFVTDRSIFRALGLPPERIKALDVSDYEGAEVIHDLNRPIPDALRASADFIVDGSTLDNVFDPAMALRNMADMLRPGGRLLTINAWNTRDSAYTLSSPPWYFDYFVANGFADCKVYICVGAGRSTNVYWLNPELIDEEEWRLRTPILATWWRRPFIVMLAEKSARSTATATPNQAQYRSQAEWDVYRANLATIQASPRPHVVRSIGRLLPRRRSWRSRGFTWIDDAYQAHPLWPWPMPSVRLLWRAGPYLAKKALTRR